MQGMHTSRLVHSASSCGAQLSRAAVLALLKPDVNMTHVTLRGSSDTGVMLCGDTKQGWDKATASVAHDRHTAPWHG
jgi:hypothetical protein